MEPLYTPKDATLSTRITSTMGKLLTVTVAPTAFFNENSSSGTSFAETPNTVTLAVAIDELHVTSSVSINDTFDFNVNSSAELPEEFTKISELSRNCVVVYCVIFLIAATGNLTVFLSVCNQLDKLKWRITVLILHLSIADLIVTFFVIPLEVFWRMTIGWIGGNSLCKICQFCRAFGLYLSSNILICISLDRFFAIVFPLRMAGAARRVKFMIVLAWIMAAVYSLPQIFVFQVESHPDYPQFQQCVSVGFGQNRDEIYYKTYNIFSVVAMFFLPLTVIIFTYGMILWKISTKSSKYPGDAGSGKCHLGSSDAAALLVRAKKRTLRLTIVIVVAFILCLSPYSFAVLWYMFDKEGAAQINSVVQEFAFMIVVLNSCVNPLIYGNYTKKTMGKLHICPCPLFRTRRGLPAVLSQHEDEADRRQRTSDLNAVTSVI